MTDFGRKDFGTALKRFFEKNDPRMADPDADEVDPFDPSAKAKLAGTDKEQDATEKDLTVMLSDFEKKFNAIRQTLTEAVNATTELFKQYQASVEGRKLSSGEVSDDEAMAAVRGKGSSPKSRALANAPETGAMTPGGTLQKASRKDLLGGLPAGTKTSRSKDFPGAAADLHLAQEVPTTPTTARDYLRRKYPGKKPTTPEEGVS